MKSLHKIFIASALAVAAIGCAPSEDTKTTNPDASANTSAAAPDLTPVANSAPAVLYFVKPDCGSNPQAMPLIKRIYEANADKGNFYVVMNTDKAGADAWAKQWNASFPIIPDPDKKIIGQYGVRSSQTGVLVDKDLKETERFAGYGKDTLVSMNTALGVQGSPAEVNLDDAPAGGSG